MAVVVAASFVLHLLLPVFFLLIATDAGTTFNINNNCGFTIWPAATPVGGGQELSPKQTWTLNVPAGTSGGRLWGRTGCSFNRSGHGACRTGDCGGELSCSVSGQAPVTFAEFTLGGSTDSFDISVTNGFNLAMAFLPAKGGPGCSKGPRCLGNTTSQCSDAFTKPTDDAKTFSCPGGTNYQLVFCPPVDIAPSPVSPQPAPATRVATRVPPRYSVHSPRATRNSSSGSQLEVVILVTGGFISLIIFLIAVICICKRRRRAQHRALEQSEEFGELQGTPVRFTFQQLKVATQDFRDKLGEGGFGTVFRGQIGEDIVAVKRLDRTGQGKREFLAEVQTIGGIHHINLVRLIGFCAEKSHRLLVYEFMPQGSLDRWIYYPPQGDNTLPLDWRMRRKIITHIAKGLCYLHEECVKRIAHLDVKPQNILLDDSFNAKLSDFGLCKLIDRDTSQVMTRMRGTPGYLAPEWLTSQITERADIYSFGVVVMEIVSGRKNLDTSRSEESIHLITLLEEKVKNGQFTQLADLIDKHNTDMLAHKQEAMQMMKLAMWCLQINSKKRPPMSDVVKVLEGTMNVETNIDYNFVATSQTIFGVARNVEYSSPPHGSDLSGPR